jgi:hypothetical protein
MGPGDGLGGFYGKYLKKPEFKTRRNINTVNFSTLDVLKPVPVCSRQDCSYLVTIRNGNKE